MARQIDDENLHLDAEAKFVPPANSLSAVEAWSQFGWLLGFLPPAAVFLKIYNYGFCLGYRPLGYGAAALLLALNLLAAGAGRNLAKGMSQAAFDFERESWNLMFFFVPLMGAVWSAIISFSCGLIFFGQNAFETLWQASAIGGIGFLSFAIYHRLLEQNGFIERKYFLPGAGGIAFVIAAFICGS